MPSEIVTTPSMFHFDEERPSFDDLSKENGFRYWSGRKLMELLGYSSWDSFSKVVNKAIGVCMTIGAKIDENFAQCTIATEHGEQQDYKLSRFACYLVAMNGDGKKPAVAQAQAYFAAIADGFQRAIASAEDVVRVDVREQVTRHERSLSGAAKERGVVNYAFLQDAGYRGLYNMSLRDLRAYKGFSGPKGRSLLDFMGRRELAANLFRITETEARIVSQDVHGQSGLEQTAYKVGTEVRGIMLRDGGTAPETLPLAQDIVKIEGDLKRTAKGLKAADSKSED